MDNRSPRLLWKPTPEFADSSNLAGYISWLKVELGLNFPDYSTLWSWSVSKPAAFWKSLWDYFGIRSHTPCREVKSADNMPLTRWFEGTTLNYAEHIFRNAAGSRPAIIFRSENKTLTTISWDELESMVASLRHHLVASGIKKGDRVAAFLPTIPEATVSFLAVNSIGAVWSGTSPDFGTHAVIDRFAQIEPRVFITTDGYQYNGKVFDRNREVGAILEKLPSVEQVILIRYLDELREPDIGREYTLWEEAMVHHGRELTFEPVPFSHPIWVLYSSGTTGMPKAIVHSHGGMLLEHLKYLSFHNDVKAGENCFWYTTTGWMMWNYIQASLLCGGTVILYDGSPAWPDMKRLWEFAGEVPIHHFGTSAAFIVACMKAGIRPADRYDLSALRSIGSTGSPLPPEGFQWIYREVKEDIWLTSISGGTDVCSAFVGGNPLWPVFEGEIQCRALGCALDAWDEKGNPVRNRVGEMVITQPMPSMPIGFWNDPGNEKYHESYFEMYPGVWRHGDWIRITPRDGLVISGRSDATLNRGGVRIGTSEVYNAVAKIPGVKDSLIVCIEREGGEFYMPLFVEMQPGNELTEDVKQRIRYHLKNDYSPRHVPDEIIPIPQVPYTLNGKKMEIPVKKILMGMELHQVISPDAMKNPGALDFFLTRKS